MGFSIFYCDSLSLRLSFSLGSLSPFQSLSLFCPLSMELFSRRRWTTGSSQQSNMYGMLPYMCCIILLGCHKNISLPLGPIQPHLPLLPKELHASVIPLYLALSYAPSIYLSLWKSIASSLSIPPSSKFHFFSDCIFKLKLSRTDKMEM